MGSQNPGASVPGGSAVPLAQRIHELRLYVELLSTHPELGHVMVGVSALIRQLEQELYDTRKDT